MTSLIAGLNCIDSNPKMLHQIESACCLTEVEQELDRVKRELAQVKQESDILKKAAACFAKESLPGTR